MKRAAALILAVCLTLTYAGASGVITAGGGSADITVDGSFDESAWDGAATESFEVVGDGGGSYAYLKYCFGNDMMYLGVCVVKSGLKSDGAVYDGVKLEISSSKLRGVCEIRYDGKILSNSISVLESGAAYSEISGIYCIEFALPLSEIAYYSEEFDVRVTVVSTELDSSSYGEAVIFKSITHTIRYEDEHVLLPVHETEYEPEDNASSKA